MVCLTAVNVAELHQNSPASGGSLKVADVAVKTASGLKPGYQHVLGRRRNLPVRNIGGEGGSMLPEQLRPEVTVGMVQTSKLLATIRQYFAITTVPRIIVDRLSRGKYQTGGNRRSLRFFT
jgi:hypothetical protein